MTTSATPSEADPAARDDGARLAAVRRYEILEAPPDGVFDQVARLAARIFGTPVATVTIVDSDRVWFAASHGIDGVREVGAEPGLCASAVLQDGPYVVTDAALDPRTLDHPLVRGELGLRFYVAAPIQVRGGYRLGTVNVIDRRPREVSRDETEQLTLLAGIVADQLELRLAALDAAREQQRLRADAERRAAAASRLAESVRDAVVHHAGAARPANCELGGPRPCGAPAELRVADAWGDSAWGCVRHVEEALITASSVFIADESMAGLARFMNRGRPR
jgi:hypothetical protein